MRDWWLANKKPLALLWFATVSWQRFVRNTSIRFERFYDSLADVGRENGSKFRETAFISLGLLVQQAATFVAGVAVARSLGVGAFGEFGILKTLATLLLIITPLGLDLALLKHLALMKNRPADVARLTTALRILVLAFNLVLLIFTCVCGAGLLQRMYPHAGDLDEFAIITVAGLAFASDMQLLGAVCRASDRVVTFAVVNTMVLPVLRAVLIAGVLLIGLQLRAVVWVTAISSAISSLVLMFASGTRLADLAFVRRAGAVVDILKESLWMAGCLAAYQAIRLLDVIILGSLTTLKATGSYIAVSTVAQLISILPQALSQRMGPDIAFHYGRNDRAAMIDVLQSYFARACLLSGFLYGGIAAFGTELDTIFGAGFQSSWPLPLLLSTGWFLSALLAPFGYVLSMTGRHRQELVILLLGVAVLVISLVVAAPVFGAEGAAAAVLTTFLFVNIIRYVMVRKTLGFSFIPWKPLLYPVAFLACAFAVKVVCLPLRHQFATLVIESVAYTAIALVVGALTRLLVR